MEEENLGHHGPKARDRRPELYDRLRLAREGAAVERCHCHPHLQRYSVGHHSLDLITLITLCWQEEHAGALPAVRLLVAAAFHDVPERVTGDVPRPIKTLLGACLEQADDNVLSWLGVNVELTAEEGRYLIWGDRLELWLWCFEEERRGNTIFRNWVKDTDVLFHEPMEDPPPPVFLRLMENITAAGGIAFLRERFVRSTAGL